MTKDEIVAWVNAQDWSKSFAELERETGLSRQVISYRYRRYTDLPAKRRGRIGGHSYVTGRKIPAGEVIDWTRQDASLARQYGVSRERMRQLRREAGAPRSPRHGRKKFL